MAVEIPGYKILRTLGRGGMATVYLAIQEVFEREVALKVMSKVLAEDPNFGQRFFREAKIVSKLVHPNIVTVHDVGMHDGYCYLSMEYIDGRDLKQVVDDLSLRQKITAVRDIAKALIYSGSKGYVHRDIKPENIMFHSSDGRAVLMDFGIARAAESQTQVTQAGTAIGTPHYMSPEQAKGKVVDGRSDIYSLGVVFFFILAGRVPYDAESAVAIGIKHITEPVPSLPKIFEGLQPIIDRMMAKDVNKRYQNARQLLDDIDELDIEVLEHAAEFASTIRSSRPSPRVSTLSQPGETGVEAFEIDDEHVSDIDAFKDYELETDSLSKERTPILPGLLAGTFVVAVIAVFVYFKHPELVQPWLDAALAEYNSVTDEETTQEQSVLPVVSPTPVAEQAQSGMQSLTSEVAITDDVGGADADLRPPPNEPDPAASPQRQEQRLAQITALKEKINTLKVAYATEAIYLSELIASYRDLMALDADDPMVRQEFAEIREGQTAQLLAFAQRVGTSPILDKRLSQFQTLFPEVKQKVIADIVAAAKTRKKVMSLILEAEAYYKQNNLTKPPGRNALDVYQKALALDAVNEEALRGKKKIVKKLSDLAARRYAAGQYGAALSSAKKVLEIDPDNAAAKRLEKKISEFFAQEQRIDTLLKGAESKISRGDLFRPANSGAFHDYQIVLRLDAENATAREGLNRVVDALSAKVWQLAGDEQFLQAKEVMRAPLREYGANPRIKELSMALDEVIGDKILDVEPRIEGMLIRGEPIDNFAQGFAEVFAADRSIFLGFRYENFQTSTTVIQAVLMDGAKRVQIAQVPVVVEGAEGRSTFRIDRPVEGFPAGSYAIEMRLGQQTLNSTLFKVE